MSTSLGAVAISNLGLAVELSRLVCEESGQDMIEYALIAATIGLASVVGVNGLAASVARYMGIVGMGFENALAHH